ncbi:MAG: TonB-dependent receptor [Prolixibacteraceae bacterium]|nr:TonB-dependent receptor [Prolixibacteraceae bacterium]
MKLTLIFTMLVFFSFGKSFSQVKVSLDFEEANIQQILEKIEEQTDFIFLYKDGILDPDKKYSIEFNDADFKDVLRSVAEKAGVDYEVRTNRQIILTEKATTSVVSELFQQRTINGIVTDSNGQPLPGVTVVIKGSTIGTVTNPDGEFSLSIPSDAGILQLSFVGLRTQEVPLSGRTTFTIVLEEETFGLDEIVAIGYGVQRKATLTGSVSSINADFIEDRPLTNSTQVLQGIEGLYVNQVGGQPGNDFATIRIRGIGTFNDNNPLILVDGVEYDLKDVNPLDIESVSVLKDAASASIYGNRAANGVILITTKKGKQSEMVDVQLHSYIGFQTPTYIPDMVTNSVDWMTSRNQAGINEGQAPQYTQEQIDAFRNSTDPDAYPNTDWWAIMTRTAPISDHNLRFSGGTDMTTYSLSVGYMDQTGVLLGSDAKRYSLSSNLTLQLSKRLQIGVIINASSRESNDKHRGSGIVGAISRADPVHPAKLSDGRYGDTHLIIPGLNNFNNPLAWSEHPAVLNNLKAQRVLINLFAEYELPYNFTYKVNYAINKYYSTHKIFKPELFYYIKVLDTTVAADRDPRYSSREHEDDINTTFVQTLDWTKRLAEKHNVNLIAGFSMESFYDSYSLAYIEGFVGNELPELNAGTINKDVEGTSRESKLVSAFGRARYNYMDKYLAEFSFRYDGSSRFASGNRWGFFPSFSGAWRISEESFMQNAEPLSNFKLRFSWGQLGNQNISLYSYVSNINLNQGYSFDENLVGGSAVTTLADPNISWEKTTMTNIGLDFGFWNEKLSFTVDAFKKVTTDILARINIPGQVGDLTGPITNLYGMSNKGIEISVNHQHKIRELSYKLGGQISFVDNNVDYMAGNKQFTTFRLGNISVIQEGSPINSWYLYIAEGLFQTQAEVENHAFQHPNMAPGDIKYRDLNNDGVIDIKDQTIVGRSVPRYTYGFTIDLDYKSFDLKAFFQGVEDVDMYPSQNIGWPHHNGAGITKDFFYNSWTPENPDAKYPRFFLPRRGSQWNAQNSTFWLKDASYLRLKNLQLGYTLSSELLAKINVSKVRFYLNGQNLLTFSEWKVTDPEREITNLRPYEYPGVKILSLGVNVNF